MSEKPTKVTKLLQLVQRLEGVVVGQFVFLELQRCLTKIVIYAAKSNKSKAELKQNLKLATALLQIEPN